MYRIIFFWIVFICSLQISDGMDKDTNNTNDYYYSQIIISRSLFGRAEFYGNDIYRQFINLQSNYKTFESSLIAYGIGYEFIERSALLPELFDTKTTFLFQFSDNNLRVKDLNKEYYESFYLISWEHSKSISFLEYFFVDIGITINLMNFTAELRNNSENPELTFDDVINLNLNSVALENYMIFYGLKFGFGAKVFSYDLDSRTIAFRIGININIHSFDNAFYNSGLQIKGTKQKIPDYDFTIGTEGYMLFYLGISF